MSQSHDDRSDKAHFLWAKGIERQPIYISPNEIVVTYAKVANFARLRLKLNVLTKFMQKTCELAQVHPNFP